MLEIVINCHPECQWQGEQLGGVESQGSVYSPPATL